MLLVSLLRNKLSDNFNRSWWMAKSFLLAYLAIQSLYIGGWFFKGYFWASVVLSPIAIIWLLVCLLDLCYRVAEKLAERYFEHGQRLYAFVLIGVSLACLAYGGYTTWTSYQIACNRSLVYAFGIFALVGLILTITKFYEKANLLTTAAYLLITSQLLKVASGSQTCSSEAQVSKLFQVAFFIFLTLVGTLFISLSDDSNEDYQEVANNPRAWETAPTQDTTLPDTIETAAADVQKSKEDSMNLFRRQTILFHIFLVLMTTLSSVLITSWKFDADREFEELLSIKSDLGAWIQGSTAVVGQLLLVWTTVAPRLFPDRTFD